MPGNEPVVESVTQSRVPASSGFQAQRFYLEGHGDLVTRLIIGIIGVSMWLMGGSFTCFSPHDPPSRVNGLGLNLVTEYEAESFMPNPCISNGRPKDLTRSSTRSSG